MNCRSEGGIQTPAYEFTRCDNVHLIHCANEGKQENPAVFLFKDCNGLLVDSLKSRPRLAAHGIQICRRHAVSELPEPPSSSRLTSKGFQTITLDRPGKHSQPRVHESAAVQLTSYPGTLRQLIVTGLGRDAPTVIIITNHHDLTTKAIIGRYARRMTIEQRLAEIIRAFCADALSSTVNLNVDLDVNARRAGPGPAGRPPRAAARLPRRHPRHPPAPLPGTPGTIINSGDTITVRLERRAYTPVLRKANLPAQATVPWWGNRTLRYEFA